MKACCNKMKPGKKVSVFLPVVISFLATQHWFHALIFLVIGGSATTMLSMEDMILFRRAMIVLTLGTLLWSVYQIVRDGWKNKKNDRHDIHFFRGFYDFCHCYVG